LADDEPGSPAKASIAVRARRNQVPAQAFDFAAFSFAEPAPAPSEDVPDELAKSA
jgi:hypothetical protein